ncbi:hypothetical protein I7I50_06521 [Histoplasma capsulatum G186AR]|uniref:Uncharacterized protein n=1 Tax=Ajellomyces capsulatus TaxID=5037 RepID=A0A8H7YXP6_AJECA|nr:hypothetical protein I7I52_10408 [Histoplasma capsulatum]QSS67439.1 hypothetical protein I7I50_06521 [Histoplasma capsulatum G186AR]
MLGMLQKQKVGAQLVKEDLHIQSSKRFNTPRNQVFYIIRNRGVRFDEYSTGCGLAARSDRIGLIDSFVGGSVVIACVKRGVKTAFLLMDYVTCTIPIFHSVFDFVRRGCIRWLKNI